MSTENTTTGLTNTDGQAAKQSNSNQPTGNAEKDPNNSNYFERKPIANTPFVAIKRGETWMAAMGDYAITQDYATEKELLKYLNSKPWEVIMTLFIALQDIDKKRATIPELEEAAKQYNLQ